MHCHTKEGSPCADVPAERVIEELIKIQGMKELGVIA